MKLTFVHAANAISAYIITAFRSDNSRFDQYIRGDDNAMTEQEIQGFADFSDIGCMGCHRAPTFANSRSIIGTGTPQIGPAMTQR